MERSLQSLLISRGAQVPLGCHDGRQGGWRPQRWSFGTRPPANWSVQISHGWLGVVPRPDTGCCERSLPDATAHNARAHGAHCPVKISSHHPHRPSCRNAPDLLTYGYTPLITSQCCIFSLCVGQVRSSPLLWI